MKEAAAIAKELCLHVPINSENSNSNLTILVRTEKNGENYKSEIVLQNHYPLTIIQLFAHLKK